MVKDQIKIEMTKKINKFLEFDLNEIKDFQTTNKLKDDEIKIMELLKKIDDEFYFSEIHYFVYEYVLIGYKITKKKIKILKNRLDLIWFGIKRLEDRYEEFLYNIGRVDKKVTMLLKCDKQTLIDYDQFDIFEKKKYLIYN